MKKISLLILLLAGLARGGISLGAELESGVAHLQQRWAEVNYQLQGKARLSAFERLQEEAEALAAQFPDSAEAWIWSGIIKSTHAGARGGLGALNLAKQSREDLEKALEIDAEALQGSAYTSLGALYYSVPGWPLGFGDDARAEELLRQSLVLNPDGIDSNYFYGQFLISEKRYDEARRYLNKASRAPSRPDRPLADAGRQREIAEALEGIRDK